MNAIVACAIETLQKIENKEISSAIKRDIAALIAITVHGKMDLAEAESFSHIYYNKYVKK